MFDSHALDVRRLEIDPIVYLKGPEDLLQEDFCLTAGVYQEGQYLRLSPPVHDFD